VFLEKWQRNAIFEAVTEAELNPRDFELEDDRDEARIRVRGSTFASAAQSIGAALSAG
jgi:hypothetical protein